MSQNQLSEIFTVGFIKNLALVAIPFTGLFSIHIVGFSRHSNYQLLRFFDATTYAQMFTELLLHLVFAVAISRVLWYGTRGVILGFFLGLNQLLGRYRIKERIFRFFYVEIMRYQTANVIITSIISFYIFGQTYLGLSFLYFAVLIGLIFTSYIAYLMSEQRLLTFSWMIRGEDQVKLKYNFSAIFRLKDSDHEIRANNIVGDRIFKKIPKLLFFALLGSTIVSFMFGEIRSSHLRSMQDYQVLDNTSIAIVAKTKQNYIAWNNVAEEYSLVPQLQPIKLLLPNENDHDT